MVTSFAVIGLCVMNILTVVYFTQAFHNLENNFDAVENRFVALEKLFVRANRDIEAQKETLCDEYAQIGKLKTEFERIRCYVYNSVEPGTKGEEHAD